MNIRNLREHDVEEWLRMRMALWPHHDPEEIKAEVRDMLGRLESQPVFVAEREGGGLCGMVEVSIRPTAEDASRWLPTQRPGIITARPRIKRWAMRK